MIRIAAYDAGWPALFDAEAARLRRCLGGVALRVEHVGSTSVPGLDAKPVIDIQVSVKSLDPLAAHGARLATLGYVHVPLGAFDRVYPFFRKPADGPGTHHVHLCRAGSEQERKHLAFRDYLRDHPAIAAEYVTLKHALAAMHDGATLASRERYSLAKSEFVAGVLARALAGGYPLIRDDA
jgi:GrpB-like predicted nucleotidyltransferase (UPF0157 family)